MVDSDMIACWPSSLERNTGIALFVGSVLATITVAGVAIENSRRRE